MKIEKFGKAMRSEITDQVMEMINRQTLTPLTAEEVFTFRIAACDDQVDRDCERFPVETLDGLAPMFVGRTVIFDHEWSAKNQSARIYDAAVEQQDGVNRLVVSAYMLKAQQADLIAAIEGGILREVSVGVGIGGVRCSVCGKDYRSRDCAHLAGDVYENAVCIGELIDPVDAYELSFVAVPAQPGAGVVKSLTKELAPETKKVNIGRKSAVEFEMERMRNDYAYFEL